MKPIAVALAILFAFTNFSKADRVLVYHGVDSARSNASHRKLYHYFWLFDLDTLQFQGIQFGGTGTQKYYSVGSPVAFVYSPVSDTPASTSKTYLAYDNTAATSGTDFALGFGFFNGKNVIFNVSQTFNGQYPAALAAVNYTIAGNGTTPGDTVELDRGIYEIDVPLTKQGALANDSLSAAVTLVTDKLKTLGYGAE